MEGNIRNYTASTNIHKIREVARQVALPLGVPGLQVSDF